MAAGDDSCKDIDSYVYMENISIGYQIYWHFLIKAFEINGKALIWNLYLIKQSKKENN